MIDICVQSRELGGIITPVAGAQVRCWDEDFGNTDDSMTGTATTGSKGCVRLTYEKKSSKWYNPCTWDCGTSTDPDIYCKVDAPGYLTLHTDTLTTRNQNEVTDFGTVTIYPERNLGPDRSNGCGRESDWSHMVNGVADFLTGFEMCCNNHDFCYSSCGETQSSCDLEFQAIMHSKCNDDWDSMAAQNACKAVADGMFALVDTFGQPSFEGGQWESNCPGT